MINGLLSHLMIIDEVVTTLHSDLSFIAVA